MFKGVPYGSLRGFSDLFVAYCEGRSDLEGFFNGNWKDENSLASVASSLNTPVSSILVNRLCQQNHQWGNRVPHLIHKLQQKDAVAVVTGQQLGVFGGPLYTLYKAMTAVKLSRKLEHSLGRPVVPVFWLEGGDHDLPEIAGVKVPGKALRYTGHVLPHDGNLGSVGELRLTSDIDRMKAELREALPATEFTDRILEGYYQYYREGATFFDSFSRTMALLLKNSPIVLMNPEDCLLKQFTVPLFESALTDYQEVYHRLFAASQDLLQLGFHAQVSPRPVPPLFYQDASGRNPIHPDGSGFSIRKGTDSVSASSVLQLIRHDPLRFTPNVVLRPLVQDTLLPTVAYVAGPGEVAYFAQFKSVYEWAGIPMPVIYPRASISLIEPYPRRVLSKRGLEMETLAGNIEVLLNKMVSEGSDVQVEFNHASSALQSIGRSLKPVVSGVDPTLSRAVGSTQASWIKDLNKLRGRVLRAQKQQHSTLRSQLTRSQEMLFPSGKMQERVLPALYYLSKYGPSLLDRLRDSISLETAQHQLLEL